MSSRTEDADGDSRAWWLAVGAVTLIAVVVRLPGLDNGLWVDEIVSVLESFRTSFPASLAEFPGDNKHPLYAIAAHAFSVLFGEHAWSVRLPAVIFGAACVPALYLLGTSLTSRRESFAASALLALSYHHVWFSQNARGYTMLAFWTLLGTWLLLRAARSDDIRLWAAYGIVSGLGAYTHLTYAFTIAGQLAVVVAGIAGIPRGEHRLHLKGALAGYLIAAATTLALYAPMLGRVANFFMNQESNLKGVSTPQWALTEGLRVLRLGFGGVGGTGVVILVAGLVVAIAGTLSFLRAKPRGALLMLAPGIVTMALSFFGRGTMYPRFFFAFIGFAFLIVMRGLFACTDWISGHARAGRVNSSRIGEIAAGLLVGLSALSVPFSWQAPKQDFEGAMRFVESAALPGQNIATADVTSLIYDRMYGRDWKALRSGNDLSELRARGPVWLVYTFPRYLMKFDPAIAGTVEKECASARRFRGTVGGGDVIVCQLPQTW